MNWIKAHKVWSAIIAVLILIIIGSSVGGGTKNEVSSDNAPVASKATSTNTQQSQPKTETTIPKYDLVGTSGSVRVYTIDPVDNTEAKLALVGKDIYKQFKSENIVRISIFTNKTQAKIMADNPLAPADLEGSAADAYDKAYVAQLNTNKNTGLKEFHIFTAGLDGPDKSIQL